MTSLKRVIDGVGPLDYRRAARYVDDVARQLSALHGTGSVHRNVQPETILIDENDRARLVDQYVGLDDDGFQMTSLSANQVSEVADYLAPEQALNNCTTDTRADIYSLGCTFYFLLTGHAPFPEGSISERLLKHQVAMASPVTGDRPDAPRTLVALCERMMLKKREHRPQTTAEVSDILNGWLTGKDVT